MDLYRRQRRTIKAESLLVLALFGCFLPVKSISSERHLVCMYDDMDDVPEDLIESIPTDLCTHVLYEGTTPYSPLLNRTDIEEQYQKFANIKNRQPDVKLLMKVACPSEPYNVAAVVTLNDTQFIENVIRFLRQYNLDGISYNMIFCPVNLVKDTKKAFKSAGHDRWTVSVHVPVMHKGAIRKQRACRAGDFTIVWIDRGVLINKYTDVQSPLYRRSFDTGDSKRFNIKDATQNLIKRGCPRDKILLRVGFRGLEYRLDDPSDHGVNAFHGGQLFPNRIAYNEICSLLQESGWTLGWDDRSKAPFAYRGKEWIGYENELSLAEKASFVDGRGLGGLVVDSIHYDDYKGVCGKKYPLLTALWKAYNPTRSTDEDPFTFAIFRTTKRPS